MECGRDLKIRNALVKLFHFSVFAIERKHLMKTNEGEKSETSVFCYKSDICD